MSVLEVPRIYFKGQISWDPITTNNLNTNYDEIDAQTLLEKVQDSVQAFRASAIDQITDAGNWNPHGSYRSSLYETTVCGFDRGEGTQANDPFSTSAVNLMGMLVDLEPYGTYSSQLFIDSMLFGVEGGYCIRAPRTSRITDRQINMTRGDLTQTATAGFASAIWTTSFAKVDGLRVDAFDSEILKDLNVALESDDVLGLTVRFNTYRTTYFDDPSLVRGTPKLVAASKKLANKMKLGGFQPNPARSRVVGVVGLWRKGEPAHEPGDRTLVPVGSMNPGPPPKIACASVRCSERSLVVDLSNSVPESDSNLTKCNFGPLSIVAVDSAGTAQASLCTIPYQAYDKSAYEASAGIVTMPLATGVAKETAALTLQVHSQGKVVLTEQLFRAVPTIPNLYLDEGQTAAATFHVYKRGVPVAAGVELTLNRMTVDGSNIEAQFLLTTDTAGIVTLPLEVTRKGITPYVPSFNADDSPKSGLRTQINTYMYVRTLPADAEIAALPPTWVNVYTRVLANWNAMAPCMDNWLRLDDPQQIRAHSGIIKRLTDPANFESFRFMPITRDMSAGARTLLYAWIDSPVDVENEKKPRALMKDAIFLRKTRVTPPAEKPEPDLVHMTQTQLGRAMREGS